MIKLDNVTKVYSTEVVAVRDATFDVPKGEFVFLVGPRRRSSARSEDKSLAFVQIRLHFAR